MMPDLREILVPVDQSAGSAGALRVAGALAVRVGGRVRALRVLEPNPFVPAAERAAVDAEVRAFVRRSAGERDVTVETRIGYPADEIVAAAEELGSGLIVIGTHGRSGLKRLILGSVAEDVLRRAPCPVLTVREAPEVTGEGADARSVALPLRRIIVATDFTSHARDGERVAADLAATVGAELYVVTVVEPDGGDDLGADPDRIAERFFRAKRLAGTTARRLAGGDGTRAGPACVTDYALTGSPATKILELADELDADLIVMATHGRRAIARLVLGSTTEEVIRAAPVPVLAVRSRVRRSHESERAGTADAR